MLSYLCDSVPCAAERPAIRADRVWQLLSSRALLISRLYEALHLLCHCDHPASTPQCGSLRKPHNAQALRLVIMGFTATEIYLHSSAVERGACLVAQHKPEEATPEAPTTEHTCLFSSTTVHHWRGHSPQSVGQRERAVQGSRQRQLCSSFKRACQLACLERGLVHLQQDLVSARHLCCQLLILRCTQSLQTADNLQDLASPKDMLLQPSEIPAVIPTRSVFLSTHKKHVYLGNHCSSPFVNTLIDCRESMTQQEGHARLHVAHVRQQQPLSQVVGLQRRA